MTFPPTLEKSASSRECPGSSGSCDIVEVWSKVLKTTEKVSKNKAWLTPQCPRICSQCVERVIVLGAEDDWQLDLAVRHDGVGQVLSVGRGDAAEREGGGGGVDRD